MIFFNRRHFLRGSLAFSAAQIIARRAYSAEAAGSTPESIKALTAAYNASGTQLFRQFRKAPGNIVFSPYSIGTAMAMTLSGARGATEEELTKVFKQRLASSEIETANEQVRATLQSYDRTTDPGYCPQGLHLQGQQCEGQLVNGACPFRAAPKDGKCAISPREASARLSIANGLMIAPGTAILPDYISLVQQRYAAEVFRNLSVEQINAWAARKTEGKISHIIDHLSPNANMTLLNAIYFQARWENSFSKSGTEDGDFSLSPSAKIKTPLMHRKSYFSVLPGTEYQAIRLPFSIPELSMIIVRPEKIDGLSQLADRLDSTTQTHLFKALLAEPAKPVDLALPKFKFGFGAGLVTAFKAAGLRLALTNEADFSGITGTPQDLKIDQILHRAAIDVTEDGIEAAAVTVVVMAAPAAAIRRSEPAYEPFIIDRPFLFFVHDAITDAVLFEGCLVNPLSV